MRYPVFLLSCFLLGGCATFNGTAVNTEVVVAEGLAPIVDGDIAGAKKASLDDALKNALGLVIGVYVSQESRVSKVLLQEDTILTQTRGYIKRYLILKESREKGFYKTEIRAEIRKDDLAALLAPPPAQQPKLHASTVKISIDETVDGIPFPLQSAQNTLKSRFSEAGFIVTDAADADILISGKAIASLASDIAACGFISYRTVLSLSAARPGSADMIAVVQETDGGADLTREAAANASLVNVAKKAAKDLTGSISRIAVQDHSVIRLTIINVNSVTCLNNILRSVRSIAGVKDCRVRRFTGFDAQIDLDAPQDAAFDIARQLEKMTSSKIVIRQAKPNDIQAICLFNNDF